MTSRDRGAPGGLDDCCLAALGANAQAVHEFFGTEPLADYLHGPARWTVPGPSGRAVRGCHPAKDERDRDPQRPTSDG